jgi:hypothetical protein
MLHCGTRPRPARQSQPPARVTVTVPGPSPRRWRGPGSEPRASQAAPGPVWVSCPAQAAGGQSHDGMGPGTRAVDARTALSGLLRRVQVKARPKARKRRPLKFEAVFVQPAALTHKKTNDRSAECASECASADRFQPGLCSCSFGSWMEWNFDHTFCSGNMCHPKYSCTLLCNFLYCQCCPLRRRRARRVRRRS